MECTTNISKTTTRTTQNLPTMSFSYKGYVLDPLKCSKLSIEEKRELVREIAKCSHGAPEMLQSWSRQELLQLLCAEMGKENKYKSLAKSTIIERLMKILSKETRKRTDESKFESKPLALNSRTTSKRQRKSENPVRLAVDNAELAKYCQNPACRSAIYPEDAFCKLCSCYICRQYDHNKDPSLWLFCYPVPSYKGDSCDMSCHLECAVNFKHERASATDARHAQLDVSCYCVSCGKVHDLLRCLWNQLLTAKKTTKVETLCCRISLSQKLLQGTMKYQKILDLVDEAVRIVEAEVGPLSAIPVNITESTVSSLLTGSEAQKLCSSAVDLLDSILACDILPASYPKVQDSSSSSPSLIRFENGSPTSITVLLNFKDPTTATWYDLWHRRADVMDYPEEPTCTLFTPQLRFTFFDLLPATEYVMKVVPFSKLKELDTSEVRFTTGSNGTVDNVVLERDQSLSTNSSGVSNPSDGDESNNLSALKGKTEDPLGNYFRCNITRMPDSSKLCDGASESQNRSNDTIREETLENSVSAVNQESIMDEVKSVPNLNVFQKRSKDSTNGNQASDTRKEETPGNSVSAVNDGCIMEEVKSDHISSKDTTEGNPASDTREGETLGNSVSAVNSECIMEEVKSVSNTDVFNKGSKDSTEGVQAFEYGCKYLTEGNGAVEYGSKDSREGSQAVSVANNECIMEELKSISVPKLNLFYKRSKDSMEGKFAFKYGSKDSTEGNRAVSAANNECIVKELKSVSLPKLNVFYQRSKYSTEGNSASKYGSKDLTEGNQSFNYGSKDSTEGNPAYEYGSKDLTEGNPAYEYGSKDLTEGNPTFEYVSKDSTEENLADSNENRAFEYGSNEAIGEGQYESGKIQSHEPEKIEFDDLSWKKKQRDIEFQLQESTTSEHGSKDSKEKNHIGEEPEIVPFENVSDKLEFDDLSCKKEEQQRDVGFQESTTEESLGAEYVHCVKVIRSLERKRYMEKNFREKFLSWYSLRAGKEERKMVKELVDTLLEKPVSLVDKLVENFSEKIFSKRPVTVSNGFCMEIWH